MTANFKSGKSRSGWFNGWSGRKRWSAGNARTKNGKSESVVNVKRERKRRRSERGSAGSEKIEIAEIGRRNRGEIGRKRIAEIEKTESGEIEKRRTVQRGRLAATQSGVGIKMEGGGAAVLLRRKTSVIVSGLEWARARIVNGTMD